LALLAAPAKAETPAEEKANPITLVGSLVLVSDYVSRGLSQTGGDPAIQGYLDLNYALHHAFAPYLGVGGSNVEFVTPPGFDRASMELDLTVGARGSFGLAEGYAFTYHANAAYYSYPDAADALNYDYYEFSIIPGLTTPLGSISVTLRWSDDYFFASDDSYYLFGAVAVPIPIATGLPVSFAAHGRYGRLWVFDNLSFGAPDYNEWRAGLTVTVDPYLFDLGIAYTGTDLNSAECFGGLDVCEDRVVFSAAKRF
jgi:uncharacterized protein (TIGR02001 family)